ncbi:averantin oxidoreductase [Polyplosphaeria fusca]|uniref:Averantin oxidoreductase n=1 Tax=Polyplosphaeria fusca TaxID=682080 RepID=A0A9P4UTS6_9PLEO|nr:averantin oxidoreductase [Polyplosphaeria fusca]
MGVLSPTFLLFTIEYSVIARLILVKLAQGTSYLIWRCIYNIYFHPLAKYPGPLLGKISPILPIYMGPIVRLMPNELAFTDPQAWRDIYGHRQGHPQFHKDPIHVGSVQDIPGSTTLTMAGDDERARQRRALSHAFSQKALLEQESIIRGYVDLFVERLKPFAASGRDLNMCDWFNFTTFDIIGDMAFGEPFGCLRDGKEQAWVKLITETIKAGAFEQSTRRVFRTGSWLQKKLMLLIPASLLAKRYKHLELSKEKCNKRLDEGLRRDHRDFLYYILRQNEKGAVRKAEIILNSALFNVAGSETAASLLAGLTMWLMRTPSAYNTLTHEIRTTFPTAESMTFTSLQNLTYMNACLEEGMRIFPSIPTGLVRTVPEAGDTVAGECATHATRNWTRPEEFLPQRWLSQEGFGEDRQDASQPFSLGPRGCIGRHLSYMELRLILGNLLWHFDIERADLDEPGAFDIWDPTDNLKHVRAFNTWDKPALRCRLKPVQRE